MAAPYVDKAAAMERLADYGIPSDASGLITEGDCRLASAELDALAPFKGERPKDQARQFPRKGETEVDPEILDWVALRAFQIGANENPPVASEGAGRVQVSYATPKLSQTMRRMTALLKPFLSRGGRITYGAEEPEGAEYVAPGKF